MPGKTPLIFCFRLSVFCMGNKPENSYQPKNWPSNNLLDYQVNFGQYCSWSRNSRRTENKKAGVKIRKKRLYHAKCAHNLLKLCRQAPCLCQRFWGCYSRTSLSAGHPSMPITYSACLPWYLYGSASLSLYWTAWLKLRWDERSDHTVWAHICVLKSLYLGVAQRANRLTGCTSFVLLSAIDGRFFCWTCGIPGSRAYKSRSSNARHSGTSWAEDYASRGTCPSFGLACIFLKAGSWSRRCNMTNTWCWLTYRHYR